MSSFTPDEIAYLQSQRLGRLATVGPDGQPHVVPVGFRYNQPTGVAEGTPAAQSATGRCSGLPMVRESRTHEGCSSW